MTRRTDPGRVSTPLPPDTDLSAWPTRTEVLNEARRATHELMWALHRQRACWARLAKVKAILGERNIEYIDNERSYKLAVGDVQWWRGEVSSRANALSALLAAAEVL
jgi:hypothetical protein